MKRKTRHPLTYPKKVDVNARNGTHCMISYGVRWVRAKDIKSLDLVEVVASGKVVLYGKTANGKKRKYHIPGFAEFGFCAANLQYLIKELKQYIVRRHWDVARLD